MKQATKKSILLLGLFVDKNNPKKNIRTATDRIAEMLAKNNLPVIISSVKSGRVARFMDNLSVIFKNKNKYNVAIVPLYGTRPAFLWQEIISKSIKFLHKKLILTIDGGSIPERMDKDPKRFLKALKRADAIVCPSAFFYNYLEKYNLNRIQIENALNLSEYTFISKTTFRPKILWMRAFEATYNPFMAVELAKILNQQYPDFEMVMAGPDNGLLAEIKKMAAESGLANKIFFPGYINLEEKKMYAQQYDFYISTNIIDNAPVSLIEFMAMGLPVISTNVGGIPDIIEDGKNGLLVDINDATAMAEKITAIIQNPMAGIKIAENAFAYSRKYGEDILLEKWQNLFENLNNE